MTNAFFIFLCLKCHIAQHLSSAPAALYVCVHVLCVCACVCVCMCVCVCRGAGLGFAAITQCSTEVGALPDGVVLQPALWGTASCIP